MCSQKTTEPDGFLWIQTFFEPPELQLLYGLLPATGHKVATEAARAMIEFGFGELGFDRIAASADNPNAAQFKAGEGRDGIRSAGNNQRLDHRFLLDTPRGLAREFSLFQRVE